MTLEEVIQVAAETAETYLGADKRHLLDEACQSARIMAWQAWKKKPAIGRSELRRVAYSGVMRALRDAAPRPVFSMREKPEPPIWTELALREELAQIGRREGPRAAYAVELLVKGHTHASAAKRVQCSRRHIGKIMERVRATA